MRLIAVLVFVLFTAPWAHAGEKESLAWAERVLAKDLTQASLSDRLFSLGSGACYSSEDAFQAVIRKYGPSGAAYIGLVRAQMFGADYNHVLKTATLALSLSPGDPYLAKALRRANLHLAAATKIAAHVDKDRVVWRCEPFPAAGQSCWLVLSAADEPRNSLETSSCNCFPAVLTHVRLSLWSLARTTPARLWTSGQIVNPVLPEDYNGLSLAVIDFLGNGSPGVLVGGFYSGGSWAPSSINAYAWRSGKLVEVLHAGGHEPLDAKDLNGDGKIEFIAVHTIGTEMSHAEQPRWPDIYSYHRGRYVISNKDFPNYYKGWITDLRRLLREYPSDWDLEWHLGMLYQICGNRPDAIKHYKRAVRHTSSVADQTDGEYTRYVRSIHKQIEQQLRALQGRTDARIRWRVH